MIITSKQKIMNYELLTSLVLLGFLIGRGLGYLHMKNLEKNSVDGHALAEQEMAEKYGNDWLNIK